MHVLPDHRDDIAAATDLGDHVLWNHRVATASKTPQTPPTRRGSVTKPTAARMDRQPALVRPNVQSSLRS
jgi:hypothetical protein